MSYILNFVMAMLPYMLFSIPLIVISRAIAIPLMKKHNKQTTLHHEILLILFIVFLIGLSSITVIPKFTFQNGTLEFVVGSGLSRINIVPFTVLVDTYTEVFINGNIKYFIINFVGNIVMFMPIGFFIPALFRKMSFKKVAIIGALSSLFVELSQLIQPRGTDIDDIWINTIGAMLGYAVYYLISKKASAFFEKCKVKQLV